MASKVRERVRFVLNELRENGMRVTHAEVVEEVVHVVGWRDMPPAEQLQMQHIRTIVREELEAREAGVQLFLPMNDTGIWSDERTYVPTHVATAEVLRREMVLAEEGARPFLERAKRDRRALEILDEQPGLTIEECLRLVTDEGLSNGVSSHD